MSGYPTRRGSDPISDVPPKVGICLFGRLRATEVALWPPEGTQRTEGCRTVRLAWPTGAGTGAKSAQM